MQGRVDRTVFLCRVEWTGLCFCAGSSGQDCVFVQGQVDRTVVLCSFFLIGLFLRRVEWSGLCFCAWLSGQDCVSVHSWVDRTVFLCTVEWTGLRVCAWLSGQDCVSVQGRVDKLQEQQEIMLLDEKKFRDYLTEVENVIRKHHKMLQDAAEQHASLGGCCRHDRPQPAWRRA